MESKQLTNEEKQTVFAMYHGQEVLCFPSDDVVSHWLPPAKLEWNVIGGTYYGVNNTILSLRNLIAITDKDLLVMCKILDPKASIKEHREGIKRAREEREVAEIVQPFLNAKANIADNTISPVLINQVFEFLKLKSYALPLFFGVGHWANGKTAIELGIAIEKK